MLSEPSVRWCRAKNEAALAACSAGWLQLFFAAPYDGERRVFLNSQLDIQFLFIIMTGCYKSLICHLNDCYERPIRIVSSSSNLINSTSTISFFASYKCLYAASVIFKPDTDYRQSWIDSKVPMKSRKYRQRNDGSMWFVLNFVSVFYRTTQLVDKREAMKFISTAYDTEHKWKGVLEKYISFLLAWLNAMVFWAMSSCHNE